MSRSDNTPWKPLRDHEYWNTHRYARGDSKESRLYREFRKIYWGRERARERIELSKGREPEPSRPRHGIDWEVW